MTLSEKFLEAFGRGNFLTKCKSAVKTTKVRMETIRRKRNSMQKFLKNDIADLLRNQLDVNAYIRAEGLYIELNMSSCYECINDYCRCISEHVKVMHKERECPKECRVAVASIIYAAARFADLPELRELRNLFKEKYGDVIESFVSEEFKLKLKTQPPSTKMKIELLKDIAKEFSIAWESKPLEQRKLSQEVLEEDQREDLESSNYIDKHIIKEDEAQGHGVEQNIFEGSTSSTTNHNSSSKANISDDKFGEGKRKEPKGSDSLNNNIKENKEHRKPFTDITAPYARPAKVNKDNVDGVDEEHQSTSIRGKGIKNQERETNQVDPYPSGSGKEKDGHKGMTLESRPKPRSVRSRYPRKQTKQPDSDHTTKDHSSGETGQQLLTQQLIKSQEHHDRDEKMVDDLLFQYSKKQLTRASTEGANVINRHIVDEGKDQEKIELPLPPHRRRYLSPNLDSASSSPDFKPRHVRAASFQPDHGIVHVHPRLPDYDELAERLDAFRKLNL